jgi:hypothetical protein
MEERALITSLCIHCGKDFQTQYGDKHQDFKSFGFCSPACYETGFDELHEYQSDTRKGADFEPFNLEEY